MISYFPGSLGNRNASNICLHPKLLPCTGQILTTCAVLQDASAPAQFERARSPACSGDEDQGEQTPLERPVRSVLVGLEDSIGPLH